MAKKQESYELMTVFSLKNGEEAVKELVEKFREKIASAATLDEVNEWGKRKLAYPINDEPDGYYTLYTFTSDGSCKFITSPPLTVTFIEPANFFFTLP